jgi:hypothetical protein
MNNLTMCQQFLSLVEIYTIQYICLNYNIYCDDYCLNDIDYNCYCYCDNDNDNIYCYNRYYYLTKFFTVIFFALLFSVICVCFYNCFRPNNNNLPSYDDIYNNNYQKNNQELKK